LISVKVLQAGVPNWYTGGLGIWPREMFSL